jgi:methionyl-tRNA synthetase
MSSSCAHCNAVEQRGRYCVGCGKLMPPSQLPARRIRLAPVHLANDDTQPVLRLRHGAPRPRLSLEETTAAV